MPAPVRVTLTAPARTDLVARFNATRDAEARLRYQMVLLAGDGAHGAPDRARWCSAARPRCGGCSALPGRRAWRGWPPGPALAVHGWRPRVGRPSCAG